MLQVFSTDKSLRRIVMCLSAMSVTVAVGGCAHFRKEQSASYATPACDDLENFEEANQLNAAGLRLLEKQKLEDAEAQFKEALTLNTNYGPAHNNLGQVYLARHQLYLAAWEFELAANLMPGRVEPVLNTGLVYELAGRHERAIEFYRQAYAMDPRNAATIGPLVRVLVKEEADPVEIHHLLKELIFYESDPEWVYWAEELVATRYREDGFMFAEAVVEGGERATEQQRIPAQWVPPTMSPVIEELPVPRDSSLVPPQLMSPVGVQRYDEPLPDGSSSHSGYRIGDQAMPPRAITEIIKVDRDAP